MDKIDLKKIEKCYLLYGEDSFTRKAWEDKIRKKVVDEASEMMNMTCLLYTSLEYGADDYMTKPFNILELKARIKAVLRRSAASREEKAPAKNELQIRDLLVDLDSRRVFVDGKEAYLTAKEFDLLELLMKTPGKVYSREKLLDTVWGFDYPGDVRTVDVHVRRLREKIEKKPSAPEYIFTKWGVGYYFG